MTSFCQEVSLIRFYREGKWRRRFELISRWRAFCHWQSLICLTSRGADDWLTIVFHALIILSNPVLVLFSMSDQVRRLSKRFTTIDTDMRFLSCFRWRYVTLIVFCFRNIVSFPDHFLPVWVYRCFFRSDFCSKFFRDILTESKSSFLVYLPDGMLWSKSHTQMALYYHV